MESADYIAPRINPWVIAICVALAAFMEVLDTSIASVALPYISGSLGASTDEGNWVITSYLVANAVILPVGGWASSVLGRKRFFLLCIALFTVSSFLCGIAPSLPLLLLFRVLQGAGGGGLVPVAQAILSDTFPPEKKSQAFAFFWCRRRTCAIRRSDTWRLDHRQLLMAMDFLHQHSCWHSRSLLEFTSSR